MMTHSNHLLPRPGMTACWESTKGSRQSLGVSRYFPQNWSLSPLYVPLTTCHSSSPEKKQTASHKLQGCSARLPNQQTTAQSQTVNTSADGSLLSTGQERKLFLEHCQQLGENKYLSMYVYTLGI